MRQAFLFWCCAGLGLLGMTFGAPAIAQVIVAAEYYIDVDPGQGNGEPVDAADGLFDSANEQLVVPAVPTSDLTIGPHQIYVRAQDNKGNWGSPFVILFEVAGEHVVASANYSVDGGAPQPLSVLMGKDERYHLDSADISTSGWSEGEHQIVTRVFDDRGNFTSSMTWVNVWYPLTITGVGYQVRLAESPGTSWLVAAANDGAFDSALEPFMSPFCNTGLFLPQDTYYAFVRAVDSRGRVSDESRSAKIAVSVVPAGSAGAVVINPSPADAPWSFVDGVQETHSGAGPATLSGVPAGYITLTWGEIANLTAPQPNPSSQSLYQNATVSFAGAYRCILTTSVVNGHGALSPPTGGQDYSAVVTLEATPDAGYRVKAWTGTDNDSATANTNHVTMTGPKTVTIEFEQAPEQYTLHVTTQGQGAVVLNPPGGEYTNGTSVTVTATASKGWRFDHWTGDLTGKVNPGVVAMNADKDVQADFLRTGCFGGNADLKSGHRGAGSGGDVAMVLSVGMTLLLAKRKYPNPKCKCGRESAVEIP